MISAVYISQSLVDNNSGLYYIVFGGYYQWSMLNTVRPTKHVEKKKQAILFIFHITKPTV